MGPFMPLQVRIVLSVSLLLIVVVACATSPLGRTQFLMNSEAQMAEMGQAAFADMQAKTPRSVNTAETGYVRCVADAITSILTPEELRPVAVTQWEVELFQDDSANAFALPGGKMGVHTGLLAVAVTPSQLATVLGHEVGHVLARHGNERVSQSTLAQTGMAAVQVLMGADTPEKQQLFGLLGVGMQYGVLMPYGRAQESEADMIGILLMARAGFDPRESVRLWQNMGRATGGQSPPEFMSTHPSHTTRIAQLEAAMPEALGLYQEATAAGRRPSCRP
jgi:predicted Zn-dependent protease